jgi:hypothetical protein
LVAIDLQRVDPIDASEFQQNLLDLLEFPHLEQSPDPIA